VRSQRQFLAVQQPAQNPKKNRVLLDLPYLFCVVLEHLKSMPSLPDDVWRQIGLHLKPRHLRNLMATNKHIKSVVDNENYWARVAFHLVWRHVDDMELVLVCIEQAECLRLPHPVGDLCRLTYVPDGYKAGVDQMFARVDQCARLYPEKYSFWNKAKFLSARDKVIISCRALYKMEYHEGAVLPSDEVLLTNMKSLCQWYFTSTERHTKTKYQSVQNLVHQAIEQIDDLTMLPSEKTKIVEIIQMINCRVSDVFLGKLSMPLY